MGAVELIPRIGISYINNDTNAEEIHNRYDFTKGLMKIAIRGIMCSELYLRKVLGRSAAILR